MYFLGERRLKSIQTGIMKNLIIAVLALTTIQLSAQKTDLQLDYEVSDELPFGAVHPDYADQLADFAPLIGRCDCKSVNRNPDGSWQDTVDMIWQYKYIMNGTAIQDETWKADGGHSGSIRQFIADSSAWAVTYFSSQSPAARPGTWMGGKVGDDIVLFMDQKAPNGMEGDSKLTFSNISESGFDWSGQWTDKTRQFNWPFWKIHCRKQEQAQ